MRQSRASCLLVGLLVTVGCNAVQPEGDRALSAAMQLPEVGIAGELPRALVQHVISLDSTGGLELDGKALAEEQLALRLHQDEARARRADESGRRIVLVRADARVPWAATVRIEELCFQAGLLRIFYVVRHCGDGVESAIGIPAPNILPTMVFPAPAQVRAERIYISVIASASADGSPGALFSSIRSSHSGGSAWIDIDGSLSTGEALRIIDAVIQGGAAYVRHVSTDWASSARDMSLHDLARQHVGRSYRIEIDHVPIGLGSTQLPCPPRAPREIEIATPWYAPPEK
jgi:hypothetical protein